MPHHLLLWLLPFCATALVAAHQEASVAFAEERALDIAILCAAQAPLLLLHALLLWRIPRPTRRLWPMPLLIACAWLAALPPRSQASGTHAPGPDLVLVTLDTFRADHLGVSGGPVPTPHLDGLAAAGLRFERAVTTTPLTAPAHASMLTGLPTLEHGLVQNGMRVDAPTVTPQLAAAGWRTGAFLASPILDRSSGLSEGFQRYEDRWGWRGRLSWCLPLRWALGMGQQERRGGQPVARALRWFEETEGPRFLWVHLFDAHAPYSPPEQWSPSHEALRAAIEPASEPSQPQSLSEQLDDLERRQRPAQRMLYAAELRWVDSLVGRLLAALPEGALIIVVGDHGEGLGEHDHAFEHGADLHEPAMRVPLLLRWYGKVAPGQVSDALVSVQDIAPTLLYAAGLSGSQGSLLAPERLWVTQYTTGQRSRGEPLPPSAALRGPDLKLLVQPTRPTVLLDLAQDPEELLPQPVPPELAGAAAQAEAQLRAPLPELDEATRQRLEALGYTSPLQGQDGP